MPGAKTCLCGKPVPPRRKKYCSERCMERAHWRAWYARHRESYRVARNQYIREHRQKNLDRYRAKAREGYRRNPERKIAQQMESRRKNREAYNAKRRKYYRRNRERMLERARKNYWKDAEKLRAEAKARYHALTPAERLEKIRKARCTSKKKRLALELSLLSLKLAALPSAES